VIRYPDATLDALFERSGGGGAQANAYAQGRTIPLDFSAGSVSGDGSSFSRRSLSLTVARTDKAEAALMSLGCQIRVWETVQAGARVARIPVHWGIFDSRDADWNADSISLTSPDLGLRVTRARFWSPRRSGVKIGQTVAQNIQQLVREVLPNVTFLDQSQNATRVADVTWDTDRAAAITELATSIRCETFLRPDGVWVLRPNRYQSQRADWSIREAKNLATASRSVDESRVYNVVVAHSDNATGAAYSAVSIDAALVAQMGENVAYYASSLFTSNSQCLLAGQTERLKHQGNATTVSYTAPRHPGVEAGDRHDVRYAGTPYPLICKTYSFDLLAAGVSCTGAAAPDDDGRLA